MKNVRKKNPKQKELSQSRWIKAVDTGKKKQEIGNKTNKGRDFYNSLLIQLLNLLKRDFPLALRDMSETEDDG